MVSAAMATVFAQATARNAHEQWRVVADQLRGKFAKIGSLMDSAKHEVLAHMDFPKAHWLQIFSTNPLERLNAEVKRRTNIVGIFPNDRAITGLVGAVLLEQSDEEALQRRHMQLKGCKSSAILLRLGYLQCSAEHRVHLSLSGLWSYTTRWDTTLWP
jgi:putative transposase